MPDVCSLLLTGNTRRGARAKLTHYGLAESSSDGAFSEGTPIESRSPARRWSWRGSRAAGRPGAVFVVGDTPHDIRCAARDRRARALAVATGGYDAARLRPKAPGGCSTSFPRAGSFSRCSTAESAAA